MDETRLYHARKALKRQNKPPKWREFRFVTAREIREWFEGDGGVEGDMFAKCPTDGFALLSMTSFYAQQSEFGLASDLALANASLQSAFVLGGRVAMAVRDGRPWFMHVPGDGK